jgi:hypothetical protein
MANIDDLSDAEFMKLQAEYGDDLPVRPICTLEDVRHLLLELVAGDAVSDEVKSALAPVLYAVTGALVADRTMAKRICSSRLNDRFAVQDSPNCPICIGTPSCCGANDGSNASE